VNDGKHLVSSWLKEVEHVKEFIDKTPMKTSRQLNSDMYMKVDLGKNNGGKLLLYFAANPGNNIKMRRSKEAYGSFKNSGVIKLDENGKGILKMKCPQCYIRKCKKEAFYKHVHFCLSDKEKTKWNYSLYTKLVICHYDYKKMTRLHKNGNIVLINSLPCEYYGKDHIPNSYNLPTNRIKTMKEGELIEWFKYVVKHHYPRLENMISRKKVSYYELPIVVYCAHKGCSASHDAVIELLKKGFVNVSEYKGGMKEYLMKR
jgi:rhodanese-related sulfurtransferase